MHVRGRAHLERYPRIAHEVREPAELDVAVAVDDDVVDDAHAVPETVGAAELQRLPDRRQPERLARVDRDVEVLAHHVLERVEVPGGRIAGLGARDVEAAHAFVAPAHRELRDLQRQRGGAHRGAQHPNRDVGALAPLPEPFEHGLDDLVEGQALLDV